MSNEMLTMVLLSGLLIGLVLMAFIGALIKTIADFTRPTLLAALSLHDIAASLKRLCRKQHVQQDAATNQPVDEGDFELDNTEETLLDLAKQVYLAQLCHEQLTIRGKHYDDDLVVHSEISILQKWMTFVWTLEDLRPGAESLGTYIKLMSKYCHCHVARPDAYIVLKVLHKYDEEEAAKHDHK